MDYYSLDSKETGYVSCGLRRGLAKVWSEMMLELVDYGFSYAKTLRYTKFYFSG